VGIGVWACHLRQGYGGQVGVPAWDEPTLATVENYSPGTRKAMADFLRPPKGERELRKEAEVLEKAEIKTVLVSPGTENAEEKIVYYRWGTGGRRVLLVHGWAGKAAQYFNFIANLIEANFEVIGFDAPAHGRSSGELASGPAFARAAREVVDKVGPLDFAIAHSMGAAALSIAMFRGMNVRKAVLLSPVAFIMPLLNDFMTSRGMHDYEREQLTAMFRSRYRNQVLSVPDMARNFRTEALILHDPDDQELPYEQAEAIAHAWPNAQLVATPNVGHWRILRSKEVIERSVAFLKDSRGSVDLEGQSEA
jgi:pimeloyl-ACP methyl ester carboxylesterase